MFNINNPVSMKPKMTGLIAGAMLAITAAMPASATVSNTNGQQNIGIQPDVVVAQRVTGEFSVNPVELGNTINDAIKTSRNRSGFVKGVMQSAYYNVGKQKYNVMVFNLSQDHDATKLKGVKAFKTANYDGVTYGIWIFKSGEFINKGHGGWINWAFKGRFQRTGKDGHHVKFRQR